MFISRSRRIYGELRDYSDPFVALWDEKFIKIFRLSKTIATNFINHVFEYTPELGKRNLSASKGKS